MVAAAGVALSVVVGSLQEREMQRPRRRERAWLGWWEPVVVRAAWHVKRGEATYLA